ncbi:hypothetical protein GCM10023172_33270 [Hymenobacter ginsengisoli]|uniref:Muconolactone isomerase domain-containing protein n=1 Tax=Hymenobacter ginsengisoli TaxID=1051626 RepID=A0ABP8QMR6_9BACT|nr:MULTISPECIES: hypothetical protein [unclassified Hymenobacter]MBO2031135.1 hypothetical protein [Hymenobacter sp. BT559]
MPAFAVSIRLPASFNQEFLAVIPKHRAFINNLLSEHVIEAYAISADRGRGWVIINSEDEATVRTIVEQFPLHPYFQAVEIDELLLFDNASARFPHISLN